MLHLISLLSCPVNPAVRAAHDHTVRQFTVSFRVPSRRVPTPGTLNVEGRHADTQREAYRAAWKIAPAFRNSADAACTPIWCLRSPSPVPTHLAYPYRSASATAASIRHELRHAIEVLDEPAIRSNAEMFQFFGRVGPTGREIFETREAVQAGLDVYAELGSDKTRR
jgi:hypothetical protein